MRASLEWIQGENIFYIFPNYLERESKNSKIIIQRINIWMTNLITENFRKYEDVFLIAIVNIAGLF